MEITIELNDNFTLYEWDQCKNAIDNELFKKLSKLNTRKDKEFNREKIIQGSLQFAGHYNMIDDDSQMYRVIIT